MKIHSRLALVALAVALQIPAEAGGEARGAYSPAPELAHVIAKQGNRALRQIRAESRESLRSQKLPALPLYTGEPSAELLARHE